MWDGPEDPMMYIKIVVEKATAVQSWNNAVDKNRLLDTELNMSDLFNPGTFLGALRQQTARVYKTSMDELKLVNAWSRGGVAGAKMPIKVNGIMIEGGVFDGVRLSPCAWDSPTFSPAPTCTLGKSHCSKSSFFVQKFNFDFPRKLSMFWVKNSWKCCGFELFSC